MSECVMSAVLFNLVIDWIMKRTTEGPARGQQTDQQEDNRRTSRKTTEGPARGQQKDQQEDNRRTSKRTTEGPARGIMCLFSSLDDIDSYHIGDKTCRKRQTDSKNSARRWS